MLRKQEYQTLSRYRAFESHNGEFTSCLGQDLFKDGAETPLKNVAGGIQAGDENQYVDKCIYVLLLASPFEAVSCILVLYSLSSQHY